MSGLEQKFGVTVQSTNTAGKLNAVQSVNPEVWFKMLDNFHTAVVKHVRM